MIEDIDGSTLRQHSTANSKYVAASLRAEGQPKGRPDEPFMTRDKGSREIHERHCFEDHAMGPTAPERSDQARGFQELRSQEKLSEDVTDPVLNISGGLAYRHDILEFENLISGSGIEDESSEPAWATHSISEHSLAPTDFMSHHQEESNRDDTESDVAMCGLGSLRFEIANSLSGSGSEIPDQQYPISFDVASQGVGTQFDRSSPVGCNLESVNLPTKDEAESILNGAIRARGGPLSSLLKISG